ncbi:unnamed protein product, partial [Coregonus sp. 'balchen']
WWKRPSGVAAVCLGLLCVLLLAGIIGLSVYCKFNGVIGHHDSTERNQLQTRYNNLTKERDQLQTSYNTLTKERDQLQTSYNTLTKERDQLQTSYNNLTKERDQLQTSYNNLTKERDQLQTSYNNLTKERDQLQTSYNNLSEERDQLQTSYNNLSEERDQLQTEREILNRRLTNLKQTYSEGWQKFESSWYFLSTETQIWKESREDCLERGADLVIINSDKEQGRERERERERVDMGVQGEGMIKHMYLSQQQTFLFNLKNTVWIGLTDSVTEGTWKWVDGRPLTTPRYWYDKQPDNAGPTGDDNCAEIHKDQCPLKAWNDLSCDSKLNWIFRCSPVVKELRVKKVLVVLLPCDHPHLSSLPCVWERPQGCHTLQYHSHLEVTVSKSSLSLYSCRCPVQGINSWGSKPCLTASYQLTMEDPSIEGRVNPEVWRSPIGVYITCVVLGTLVGALGATVFLKRLC